MDETFAEEARGVVVAAAAEACADRVVAAVAARVPSAESLEKSRFEPDAPERGRGYPKPPAALVSALRALVGCVSATGASGAEAAHGALYRAADAVWALSCLDAYEAKAAAHAKRVTEVSSRSSAAPPRRSRPNPAPSSAFGWDPHVVLAFCARSCASIASPAPELADAVASLAPPGASDARARDPRDAARKAAEAAKREDARSKKPRMGTDGGALLFAAERDRSRFVAGVVDAARLAAEGGAAAASAAVAACPSGAVGDALASVAGRARATRWQSARRPRRASPRKSGGRRTTPRRYWTRSTSTSRRTASPGTRARPPPRLLGLEPEPKRAPPPRLTRVSLDDSAASPLGPRRGPGSRRRRSWRRRTRARASRRASGRRRRRRSRPASGPR